MNRTRGSTPPEPTPDLPIRSIDSNKTLGIVGTPYGHSIAKLWCTKIVESRGIDGFLPRTHQTLRQQKSQNRAPILTDLGGESKGKNHEGFMHTSRNKSPRKRSRNPSSKNAKKMLQKSPKRKTGKNSNKP
jgi:hypothetical protein